MTDSVRLARAIATGSHQNKDWPGEDPHIEHVERVVERVQDLDIPFRKMGLIVATAWLHDIIEDTPWTVELLEEAGVAPVVVRAVDLLTRKGEPYAQYIEGVAEAEGMSGEIARIVKRADLNDNLARCWASDADLSDLARRYVSALGRLGK